MIINLIDVAEYYKGEPQQKEALEFLQTKISEPVLEEFAKIYRKKPPKPASPLEKIKARLDDLGIELNSGKNVNHYRVNILGLEGCDKNFKLNSDSPYQDDYNDTIILVGVNSSGRMKLIGSWKATTEPGLYYTRNPLNSKGAARMAIDIKQEDIWQIGRHKGYEALAQTGNKVKVYRDYNKDYKRTGDKLDVGWFGINLHYGAYGNIGKYSAGCQVICGKKEFLDFMTQVKKDRQSKYDYILLDASKIF